MERKETEIEKILKKEKETKPYTEDYPNFFLSAMLGLFGVYLISTSFCFMGAIVLMFATYVFIESSPERNKKELQSIDEHLASWKMFFCYAAKDVFYAIIGKDNPENKKEECKDCSKNKTEKDEIDELEEMIKKTNEKIADSTGEVIPEVKIIEEEKKTLKTEEPVVKKKETKTKSKTSNKNKKKSRLNKKEEIKIEEKVETEDTFPVEDISTIKTKFYLFKLNSDIMHIEVRDNEDKVINECLCNSKSKIEKNYVNSFEGKKTLIDYTKKENFKLCKRCEKKLQSF